MSNAAGRAWRCVACGQPALAPFDSCPRCGAWGVCAAGGAGSGGASVERARARSARRSLESFEPRAVERLAVCEPWATACGGGLAVGSSALVYGRAGVGKTTACIALAASVPGALYLAAEPGQGGAELRQIAARLSLDVRGLLVAEVETLADAVAALSEPPRPPLAIVDSLSVLGADPVESWRALRAAAPGAALVALVHQTKDGRMVGRETLRHLADAVLCVQRRALRVEKNRHAVAAGIVRAPR